MLRLPLHGQLSIDEADRVADVVTAALAENPAADA